MSSANFQFKISIKTRNSDAQSTVKGLRFKKIIVFDDKHFGWRGTLTSCNLSGLALTKEGFIQGRALNRGDTHQKETA